MVALALHSGALARCARVAVPADACAQEWIGVRNSHPFPLPAWTLANRQVWKFRRQALRQRASAK
eukprot:7025106-Alexandrium_andersonii.AAC.1